MPDADHEFSHRQPYWRGNGRGLGRDGGQENKRGRADSLERRNRLHQYSESEFMQHDQSPNVIHRGGCGKRFECNCGIDRGREILRPRGRGNHQGRNSDPELQNRVRGEKRKILCADGKHHVLLKNLNPTITQNAVRNYLERGCDIKVKDFTFSFDHTAVMVELQQPPGTYYIIYLHE